eukprot:gene17216-18936_t
MPSLDLKLHVRDVGGAKKIVHEFYAKAVSSKAMINAESTLPMRQKRTILTQEVPRVLLNCSACIPWEEVAQHVSNMVLRMQFSGFPKTFWYEIVNSALKAYDEKPETRTMLGDSTIVSFKDLIRSRKYLAIVRRVCYARLEVEDHALKTE